MWNLLLGVKGLRDNPSVTCGDSSPKGEPDRKKASPLGEGDRRRRWRDSLWNLLLGVKDLRNNPSVSLRLPAPFSREPDKKAAPERGGEPSLDGGGVPCETFCLV